jgi:hypothetical protein
MSSIFVTLDLDWACEPAIEETLDYFEEHNIPLTIFTTHPSRRVEESMLKNEVGLHPYFGEGSSHGSTIKEVVSNVMDLPHNIPAFRCHRFATCNSSRQAMVEAGMKISSNVCTDLEVISPFKERFGLLEVPVFLEDGGYLWRKHDLQLISSLQNTLLGPGTKVLLLHPMHFALNTPHFSYMYDIKQSLTREEWQNMTKGSLKKIKWKERGIRDLIIDIIKLEVTTSSFKNLLAAG